MPGHPRRSSAGLPRRCRPDAVPRLHPPCWCRRTSWRVHRRWEEMGLRRKTLARNRRRSPFDDQGHRAQSHRRTVDTRRHRPADGQKEPSMMRSILSEKVDPWGGRSGLVFPSTGSVRLLLQRRQSQVPGHRARSAKAGRKRSAPFAATGLIRRAGAMVLDVRGVGRRPAPFARRSRLEIARLDVGAVAALCSRPATGGFASPDTAQEGTSASWVRCLPSR